MIYLFCRLQVVPILRDIKQKGPSRWRQSTAADLPDVKINDDMMLRPDLADLQLDWGEERARKIMLAVETAVTHVGKARGYVKKQLREVLRE